MSGHLVSLGIIDGASDVSNLTLTDADLQAIQAIVWNYKPDGVHTAKQLMNLFSAVLGGKVDKYGNLTPDFKSFEGTKSRLKYLIDDLGNRIKLLYRDLN